VPEFALKISDTEDGNLEITSIFSPQLDEGEGELTDAQNVGLMVLGFIAEVLEPPAIQ
jgi:hypothetical protein